MKTREELADWIISLEGLAADARSVRRSYGEEWTAPTNADRERINLYLERLDNIRHSAENLVSELEALEREAADADL